jgi:hypothetical protein
MLFCEDDPWSGTMYILRAAILTLAIGAACSGVANAEPAANSSPLVLKLGASAGYDDNVVVSQLDTTSGRGDMVYTPSLNLGYKILDDKTNQVAINYGFSASIYQTLGAFDLQSHDITLNTSHKFGATDIGGTFSYYHMLLVGKPLLDMYVANPGLLTPIGKDEFLRVDWFYTKTSFQNDPRRDADHHQPETQLYYFFGKSRNFILIGANYQFESASGAEFSYKGFELKGNLKTTIPILSDENRITVAYSYLHRNYDNITPTIGVKRFENRSTIRVGGEFYLAKNLGWGPEYTHIDRQSNLKMTNYVENIFELKLRYKM